MKSAADAFALAINRAEKSLKRKSGTVTPQERGHAVTKLSEARVKKRAQEAHQFAHQARRFGLDADTLSKIDHAAQAHAHNAEKWIFAMISTDQQAAVIDWISANSKRPMKAMRLWGHMLANIDQNTGEIMVGRRELADLVDMNTRNLSSTMTELASINAVRRVKEGRSVRYFLNPHIATHIPTAAARAKAREDAGPLLKLMEGGKNHAQD